MSRNSLGHLLNDQGKQEAAEAEYRKAIVLWEKLAADFPAVPEYRVSLGGSYCNIGILVRDSGKPADCLPWFKKAIATLSPVHEAEPYDVTAKQFLWNSVAGRVISYQLLQRYTDALADCELVIQLSPPKGLAWSHFNHGKVLDAVGERTKAEAAFDRSLALREAAAKVGNADDKDAHWQLAQCLIDRGLIYLRSRRPEESIVWMDRAEEAYTRIGKRWPGPEVTSQLRWCHQNRAIALDRLGRRTDAIKEWDQALERCPKEDQNVVRAKRATSRVLGGMVVEAVADISELSKLPNWTAGQLYDFACVYAMAAGKLADKKQEYTDAAMGMLSKAVRGGFKNHAHIKTDTDLDSLRDRDDFKKLIAELEAKFPPMKDSKK